MMENFKFSSRSLNGSNDFCILFNIRSKFFEMSSLKGVCWAKWIFKLLFFADVSLEEAVFSVLSVDASSARFIDKGERAS